MVVSGPRPAQVFEGATAPPGGPHAEVTALARAGERHARGATLFTTLEPCAHHGRTPPCTDAIIAAGVARVVIGIEDPDPQVAGQGVAALRAAGIEVTVGTAASEVAEQLAPYLKHRTTGRPWVVLKMAASLDGADRRPGRHQPLDHRGGGPRATSIACGPGRTPILVGAGTVRADDPAADGPAGRRAGPPASRCGWCSGEAPPGAEGAAGPRALGRPGRGADRAGTARRAATAGRGGATVAHDFHAAGLVDRYVLYLAPALFGGDDGRPIFAGPGAGTIEDVWRGKLVSVERLGEDLRVEVAA